MSINKVALFTNEYPPNVYGGAGVHVEYLSRALAKLIEVEVRCFGDGGGGTNTASSSDSDTSPIVTTRQDGRVLVREYAPWEEMKRNTDPRFASAMGAFSRSLAMAKDTLDADVVHCHTWYTQMGGLIAAQLWDIPFLLTTHSLEPLRPWKVEQLGTAYHLSSWMEKTAIESADRVITVSRETDNDVRRLFSGVEERTRVIHNGIDLQEYVPDQNTDAIRAHGIDPERPYVLFVGRITRQKGIIHLVDAIPHIDPATQIVLLAGAPDTPEIATEMTEHITAARQGRNNVFWIDEMLPRPETIQFYSHATVFACPSVYEPFGIINLEAMACETAVVASQVGGIPEVVVPDETGVLVDPDLVPGTFTPKDPDRFSRDLATAINAVVTDPERARRYGQAGRVRAEQYFSWDAIAERTLALYEEAERSRDGGTAGAAAT
ncbi:MAG: glycogen synthase [Spirochaeta sp.]|jgi:starch synthase|nr:glycogen synthase [Spirochaeta sp.]